jgi:hypothetical protein
MPTTATTLGMALIQPVCMEVNANWRRIRGAQSPSVYSPADVPR